MQIEAQFCTWPLLFSAIMYIAIFYFILDTAIVFFIPNVNPTLRIQYRSVQIYTL